MTTITERSAVRDTGVDELLTSGRLLPAVLDHLESNHPRSQQLYPGHSSVGRCRRQAGYGYSGVPADDGYARSGSVAAWVGTAVHTAFLPVLRNLLAPARIELSTTWAPRVTHGDTPPITGHVDLYRRRSELALDLKTVSRHQLDLVRREGARLKDLLQLHANAASLNAEGKPCTRVALLYVCTETSMDRSDGEGLLYVQEVDPELTATVVRWWAEVTSTPVDELPRDERGPGLSFSCDWCPFLRRCWGEDAMPGQVGAQAVVAVEDDAIASALQLLADANTRYTDAGRAQRKAEADKDFAAAILTGTAEGAYSSASGQTYELSWKPGQMRLDQQEAARLLEELNIGVPRKRGSSKPAVKVIEQ
jgi:hypothetical protein